MLTLYAMFGKNLPPLPKDKNKFYIPPDSPERLAVEFSEQEYYALYQSDGLFWKLNNFRGILMSINESNLFSSYQCRKALKLIRGEREKPLSVSALSGLCKLETLFLQACDRKDSLCLEFFVPGMSDPLDFDFFIRVPVTQKGAYLCEHFLAWQCVSISSSLSYLEIDLLDELSYFTGLNKLLDLMIDVHENEILYMEKIPAALEFTQKKRSETHNPETLFALDKVLFCLNTALAKKTLVVFDF